MIDTDELIDFDKAFKEYPVSDYWPQTKRIQALGMKILKEYKRLHGFLSWAEETHPAYLNNLKQAYKKYKEGTK